MRSRWQLLSCLLSSVVILVCVLACGGPSTKLPDGASCPSGQSVCNATCVDLSIDDGNCGSCDSICPASQHCNNGSCSVGCSAPRTDCRGACIDTRSDPSHCGT